MSTAYQGRHSGGVHRTPAGGKTTTAVYGLSHALRRPLASAGAILAVAGVSAAGSSQASQVSAESFTASPMAVAQASELSHNRDDTNVALAAARRSGVQRASALTHRQQAAADALVIARARAAHQLVIARARAAQELVRAREAAAQELVRAREAAAQELARVREQAAIRVARASQRQDMLSGSQSDPRATGRVLAEDRGWGGAQFACLDSLWTKESGWRWNADNASSDAYGIPQALPGSKMASFGSDWATNPITQIKWGLQYISGRYGTPCSAWSHSQAVNWY